MILAVMPTSVRCTAGQQVCSTYIQKLCLTYRGSVPQCNSKSAAGSWAPNDQLRVEDDEEREYQHLRGGGGFLVVSLPTTGRRSHCRSATWLFSLFVCILLCAYAAHELGLSNLRPLLRQESDTNGPNYKPQIVTCLKPDTCDVAEMVRLTLSCVPASSSTTPEVEANFVGGWNFAKCIFESQTLNPNPCKGCYDLLRPFYSLETPTLSTTKP